MRKQFDKPRAPKNQKPKMTVTLYEKAFESISTMIEELKTLHPEFSNIFPYEDTATPRAAAYDVIKYFEDNLPDIETRSNLPMNIYVSSNRITLKTNMFFSIEWTFKYDREANITDLVATVTTFTKEQNSEELTSMIDKLVGANWTIKEPKFNK